MNNIDELIAIIEEIGGKATAEQICYVYLKKYRMVQSSSYLSVIQRTLSNSDKVIKEGDIWMARGAGSDRNEVNRCASSCSIERNMDTDDFMENIIGIINSVTGQNLKKKDCNVNGKRLSFRMLRIYQPNRKDLNDPNHIHYNPRAIINVMPKQDLYERYRLYDKPGNAVIDGDGYPWICIEKTEDFVSLVEHLHKLGYSFDGKKTDGFLAEFQNALSPNLDVVFDNNRNEIRYGGILVMKKKSGYYVGFNPKNIKSQSQLDYLIDKYKVYIHYGNNQSYQSVSRFDVSRCIVANSSKEITGRGYFACENLKSISDALDVFDYLIKDSNYD